MTLAALTRFMMERGVSPDVVEAVVECVTRYVTRYDNVTPQSLNPAAVRMRRYRQNQQNLKQNQGGAKANDVAQQIPDEPNGGRNALRNDVAKSAVCIKEVRSINEGREEEKERKKEGSENARARGTRLPEGAILTEPFRQAALQLGARPEDIPDMWAEFADYWPAVPGHRGVKLNWLLTWRSRVRETLKRGKPNGHGPAGRGQSLSDLAFELAEQARSAEREAGIIRSDDPFGSH